MVFCSRLVPENQGFSDIGLYQVKTDTTFDDIAVKKIKKTILSWIFVLDFKIAIDSRQSHQSRQIKEK